MPFFRHLSLCIFSDLLTGEYAVKHLKEYTKNPFNLLQLKPTPFYFITLAVSGVTYTLRCYVLTPPVHLHYTNRATP